MLSGMRTGSRFVHGETRDSGFPMASTCAHDEPGVCAAADAAPSATYTIVANTLCVVMVRRENRLIHRRLSKNGSGRSRAPRVTRGGTWITA